VPRPIGDLIEVGFGISHRLEQKLGVDRRHAPDHRLDSSSVERALGQSGCAECRFGFGVSLCLLS